MESKLILALREGIRKELDEEYTEYKKKKLEEFDFELERKRNEVVQNILNNIDILQSTDGFAGEINYTIKVTK